MLKDHYHSKPTKEILLEFETSALGLGAQEAAQRLERFGTNSLPEGKTTSPLSIFIRQFKNLMVVVLAAAAVLSFYYQHYLDVGVIILVIAINAIIGFVQEYRAERAIVALKHLVVQKAKVKRDDTVYQIAASDIVPGDIILLEEGDRVPADARVLYAKNLQCAESMLTGESLPSNKNANVLPAETALAEQANMLFSGTTVVHGHAEAVVVATGANTALGRIAKGLEEIADTSGQHFLTKNNELVKQMSALAFGVAALTFLVGYFVRGFGFEEILVFTLAALVSGIPESLPIIVIVVLSLSAHRMAKRNAIVRTLPSTETLSVVDVIITDKTGTLTQNKMEVKEIHSHAKEKLYTIARYCNNVRVQPAREGKEEKLLGDPTEIAFYQMANKNSNKVEQLNKVDDIPFDQKVKARASVMEVNKGFELFAVGAPESLLARASHYLPKDGKVKKLTSSKKALLEAEIEKMTNKAMRTIGFVYKPIQDKNGSADTEDISNMVWVGAVGIVDPPRAESASSIAAAKKAGIKVIMATGDHPKTAVAIAKEIGLTDNDTVYTASDIAEMSDENLLIAAKEANVFARMIPESKLRLAQVLQGAGHTIAMTGDGVNDGPALKAADIGISMGKSGTDVARESSDIILADDNFATIINAIEEGRTQFRNIRRTSFFLVTTNMAQSVSLVTFLLLGLPLPLLPKQILWINLVGSGVTDIALATEPIHDDVLDSPPRNKNEKILNRSVIPMLVLLTVIMTAGALGVFWVLSNGSDAKARTAIFTLLSLMQMVNMFNVRSLKHSVFKIGMFTNKNVNLAFLVSLLLLLGVIYIPFLAHIFEFEPLSVVELVWIAVVSTLVLWFGEILKKFGSPAKNSKSA